MRPPVFEGEAILENGILYLCRNRQWIVIEENVIVPEDTKEDGDGVV